MFRGTSTAFILREQIPLGARGASLPLCQQRRCAMSTGASIVTSARH